MSAESGAPGRGGQPGAAGAGAWPPRQAPGPWSLSRRRACAAAAVLCYINLLNYMNWFVIAGMLLDIQNFFQISDSNAGLLQTAFVCCLLLSAPVFGYLGDRHSRKATLSMGILLWSGAGLSSSFISPQYSRLFFLSRGVVGIGSASYSTIAPTVLGDLFVRDQRTRVLAVFYIFIPVGSGLGYVLGSAVLQLTGDWRWAFRVMPCLEAVALILLIALVPDPPRGAAEKQEEAAMRAPRSSWCEDVRSLGRNWSFVWSTLGVTAIAFVTGALGFWAPKFLFEARVVHGLQPPCLQDPCDSQDSLIFGMLTVVTGIIGVALGAEASRRYKKVNPRAEPLICACSLLTAAPCLYLALILAPVTLPASYLFLSVPGPRGAASVLQLGGGCRHPAVRGGAPVPGDSGGAPDHRGPRPGRRRQPLPHWAGLQRAAGPAARLLPAVLPQPPAERSVLCLRHRPGGRLLPANCAAPGEGPGPGPAAWHRDLRRQGCREPSPAFRHGCQRRGPLRPPRPTPASSRTASAPQRHLAQAPGPRGATPAAASRPAGALAVPVGCGLSCQLPRREAWAAPAWGPHRRPWAQSPRVSEQPCCLEPPGFCAGSGGRRGRVGLPPACTPPSAG